MNEIKYNSQNVNYIHDKLKSAYNLGSDNELAEKLKMKPSTLSMQKKRGTVDFNAILENCTDIDFNWLFKSDTVVNDDTVDYKALNKSLEDKLNQSLLENNRLRELLSKSEAKVELLKSMLEPKAE